MISNIVLCQELYTTEASKNQVPLIAKETFINPCHDHKDTRVRDEIYMHWTKDSSLVVIRTTLTAQLLGADAALMAGMNASAAKRLKRSCLTGT